MTHFISFSVVVFVLALAGCAGMKVVNPNEQKEQETKMVDWSGGTPKIISPYNCKLESMGNKFSALGKTEEEAKTEVLARCRDKTVISFCKAENIACSKNK